MYFNKEDFAQKIFGIIILSFFLLLILEEIDLPLDNETRIDHIFNKTIIKVIGLGFASYIVDVRRYKLIPLILFIISAIACFFFITPTFYYIQFLLVIIILSIYVMIKRKKLIIDDEE